jgi:hypothetical protein
MEYSEYIVAVRPASPIILRQYFPVSEGVYIISKKPGDIAEVGVYPFPIASA